MATEDGSDGDDAMAASSAPSDSAKMKVMVAQALDELDFRTKRPAKMDLDDILLLLESFNKKEIHFT